MQSFSEYLLEQKLSKTAYHGSNSRFSKFDAKKARIPNDFYGGGIAYFTDDLKIGIQYAKGMSKKTGEPLVYTVKLTFKKLFDVDDIFTGKDLINILPDDIDSFARGAKLMSGSKDKFEVMVELKRGDIKLTGDQVWKGLSLGQVNTAKAREYLISKGYDGLRYNGGVNMGMKKHSVYLAYYPKSITIEKRQKLAKKG